VIALSIAAVLAVFLLYTSIAGGGTPSIKPSELEAQVGKVSAGKVSVAGLVVGPVTGDPYAAGMRFRLRDIKGDSPKTVAVVYKGSVPDLFKIGRHVVVDGKLQSGTFIASPGSMVTKCPSKYTAVKPATQ